MGDKLLERFRTLRPRQFDGASKLRKAEQWLREMETIFETMECNEHDKHRLATFQLIYATADWWESEKAKLGVEAIRRMPWTTFRERFLEK